MWNRYVSAALVATVLVLFACHQSTPQKYSVLLFDGEGIWSNDVSAIKKILKQNAITYTTADSRDLNQMSVSELRAYQLLIIPGGNFEKIGNGLSANATANIRQAVSTGLNYFGICAGAFFAGDSPYNGLNLTGVRFGFYGLERQNIRRAAVAITIAGTSPPVHSFDHYWEDGPQLTGWGETVAKYPDATPAVVQGSVDKGWVILSGIHPEAPESWRDGLTFSTSAEVDNAFAATLIDAALGRKQLAHF